METAYLIEELLNFGVQHQFIGKLDKIVARNTLLDLFGLSEPYKGEVNADVPPLPTDILNALVAKAEESGIIESGVPAIAINFETRIMG
ncbi:MAG: galactose-1-phosphate uridylyltransferase, partial [Oscillospiraceae bacterium]